MLSLADQVEPATSALKEFRKKAYIRPWHETKTRKNQGRKMTLTVFCEERGNNWSCTIAAGTIENEIQVVTGTQIDTHLFETEDGQKFWISEDTYMSGGRRAVFLSPFNESAKNREDMMGRHTQYGRDYRRRMLIGCKFGRFVDLED